MSKASMRMPLRVVVTLLLVLGLGARVRAEPRAWLEPDHVAFGETATLNVESDQLGGDAPDFSALQADFALRGQSSSTQVSIVNGQPSSRTLYAVALEPRRAGVLSIPALKVGKSYTAPISLSVGAAEPGSAAHGDAVFIEAELGLQNPYVQQAVPYTVRLYFSVPLLNGGLDVNAPDQAGLQRAGEDRQYQHDVGGRRYHVLERKFLLIPEKSGPLELPAPVFRGQAQTNDISSFFGRDNPVSAVGKSQSLTVRPQPADAPQPWLAANGLHLSRADVPGTPRAGEPLMLEFTLNADGITAAQLPELTLPSIAGAQVFPEPPKSHDNIVDGRPSATVTRRFALVPAQSGALKIPELRLPYWNTLADRADSATLPALNLAIAPGLAAPIATGPAAAAAGATPTAAAGAPAPRGEVDAQLRYWRMLAISVTVALLLALVWGWRRGATTVSARVSNARSLPTEPAPRPALKAALANGDLRAIADALLASTTPSCSNLGALRARLDDTAQRDAVLALERALWAADADAAAYAATRAQLRAAFGRGPRLSQPGAPLDGQALAPLYPSR